MIIIDTLGQTALVLLAVAAVGALLAVVAAAVLVTLAVHIEERRETLAGPAPGRATRLARRLLAAPAAGTRQHSRRIAARSAARQAPEKVAARSAVRQAPEKVAARSAVRQAPEKVAVRPAQRQAPEKVPAGAAILVPRQRQPEPWPQAGDWPGREERERVSAAR